MLITSRVKTFMLTDVSHCVCRFLVDVVKAGVELCRVTDKLVTKEHISETVKFFMTEGVSTARKNVRKLQKLALNAVALGASVQKNLEDFTLEVRFGKQLPNGL